MVKIPLKGVPQMLLLNVQPMVLILFTLNLIIKVPLDAPEENQAITVSVMKEGNW